MMIVTLHNAIVFTAGVFAILVVVYAIYRTLLCFYLYSLRRDRVSHRTNTIWRTVSDDFGDEYHGRWIHLREYRRVPREGGEV